MPKKSTSKSATLTATPIPRGSAINPELMEDALLVTSVRKEQQLQASLVEAKKSASYAKASVIAIRPKLQARLQELKESAANVVLASLLKSGLIPTGVSPRLRITSQSNSAEFTWRGTGTDSNSYGEISVALKLTEPTDVVELRAEIATLEKQADAASSKVDQVYKELSDLPKYERLLKTALAEERLKASDEGVELLKKIGESPLLKQFQLSDGK